MIQSQTYFLDGMLHPWQACKQQAIMTVMTKKVRPFMLVAPREGRVSFEVPQDTGV